MNKLLSFLGLCRKAGKLELGENPCMLAVKGRLCRVLILASDASDGTARRAKYLCDQMHCFSLTVPADKAALGAQFGRSSVALAAITDPGLAAAFLRSAEAAGLGSFPQELAQLDAQRDRKPKKQNRPKRR